MDKITRAEVKWIKGLQARKERDTDRCLVVEGKKMVSELVELGWSIRFLVATDPESFSDIPALHHRKCGKDEMSAMSSLESPEGLLAVVDYPDESLYRKVDWLQDLPPGKSFWLDGIQDPGNLGTILRIADWFGFGSVVCGPGTADCYNPKALRASMGSVFRIPVIYTSDWASMVLHHANSILIADMEGIPTEKAPFHQRPYLLIGNEANGVSGQVRNTAGVERVTISRFGKAESLNAAISAGILAYASCTRD